MTQETGLVKDVLDAQWQHWEQTFAERPEMFGDAPSEAARKAAALFQREGVTTVLELGGGQGRDTLFFAQQGFQVTVLDYAEHGVQVIAKKAQGLGLSSHVTVLCHDVRTPLPFANDAFDACYSLMLFCMALTTPELERLSADVRRVLTPGGLHVYTVRTTADPHYGTGIYRGEDMYEVGGFIVHFFSKAKVAQLATGYEIVSIDECEERGLPRKLFRVTLRKQGDA
jgi:cyclopropane fatty-acyl-phospholipid synthase-like methyltransferase